MSFAVRGMQSVGAASLGLLGFNLCLTVTSVAVAQAAVGGDALVASAPRGASSAELPGLGSPSASALSGPPPAHRGPPGDRAPPPFAYQACEDKEQGHDCSVSLGDHEIAGSCVRGLDKRLFCLPDEPPPARSDDGSGDDRRPPPDDR